MTIIVEDAETQQFLASEGNWTKEPNEGTNYSSTRLAVAAAKREDIGKFNVVGYFGDTRQFVNMDHGKGKGSPGARSAESESLAKA